MAFTVPKVPIIIASVCLLLALIFQLVGIAGPAWVVQEGQVSTQSGPVKYTNEIGIFRSCSETDYGSDCDSTDADVDWQKAVQAFAILGLLALIGAMVLAVLHFFKEDAGLFSLIAAIVSGVAAFCILIEFAVFAGKIEDAVSDPDYGYAFILTIIAFIASIAAAILFFVGKASSNSN